MPQEKSGGAWRLIGEFTGLAMTLPIAGLVGFAIGDFLDSHWHTGKIFSILFTLFGCGAGLFELIRVALRAR